MLPTLEQLVKWVKERMPLPLRKPVQVKARRPPFGLRRTDSGQAAIEFMMIIVVLFFFLFLLLSISIVIVVSEYIEYATFMGARTYKSGFSSERTQRENANTVFQKYFSNVQGIARNPKVEFRRVDDNNEQTAGMLVSYNMDLFYLPPLFGPGNTPPSRVSLVSETHLGRDPSFDEVCNPEGGSFFFNLLSGVGGLTNIPTFAEQMDDNGC